MGYARSSYSHGGNNGMKKGGRGNARSRGGLGGRSTKGESFIRKEFFFKAKKDAKIGANSTR